jgi:hypothetical protein
MYAALRDALAVLVRELLDQSWISSGPHAPAVREFCLSAMGAPTLLVVLTLRVIKNLRERLVRREWF